MGKVDELKSVASALAYQRTVGADNRITDLEKEAEEYVNAIIDTFKQDVKGTLYGKLNQEDVKDFLYSLYVDSVEPREKRIEELEKELKNWKDEWQEQVQKAIDEGWKRTKLTGRVRELEEENERLKGDLELWKSGGCRATNLFECGVVKELKEQIEKMKCCQNCDHYRWSDGDDWCNDHYGQPMYDEECKEKWKLGG